MQEWFAKILETAQNPWAVVGFAGQVLFFSRWIVQWIASEKKKESHVPVAFWYISFGGGLTLLVYAIKIQDPVFVVGQVIGIANYARNIFLIHRHPRPPQPLAQPEDAQ